MANDIESNTTRRIIIEEERREGPVVDTSSGKPQLLLNPDGKYPCKFSLYSSRLILQAPDIIQKFVDSEAKDMGDNLPEGVALEDFKGNPLLVLNSTSQYPLKFGLYKARLVLENMEAIERFVSTNGAEA